MSFNIITGDVTAEVTDEDGNPIKIDNDRLLTRDRQITQALDSILECLESIDKRLARMESE